jgi:integrase/recombinase XerD
MPKLQKGKAYVPNSNEIKRLLKLLSDSTYAKRDTLLILMSYGLGLRVLELASLKLHHVFNEDETINENISLVRTKGNKPRTVYLPNPKEDRRIHDCLKEYLIERKAWAEKKHTPFSLQQPLFLSQKGVAFSNKTLQKRFEYLYKMAGIRGASSHSGRRTYATNLIEAGIDIKAVSTLMGHSSVAMTARYVEDNPTRLKKIASVALKFL